MGLPEDAFVKYHDFDLIDLQEMVRERTGNLRRNKNRGYCLKKVSPHIIPRRPLQRQH